MTLNNETPKRLTQTTDEAIINKPFLKYYNWSV